MDFETRIEQTDTFNGKHIKLTVKKENDIVKSLGGLPAPKIHCSMLGVDALRQAIKKYKSKK